jgi:hypothetical protein
LPKRLTVSWEKRREALASSLRGVGLRSLSATKLMRRMCDDGDAQLVLEAAVDVLLSEAVLSRAVPANVGVLSKDFALAAEGALRDVARAYLDEGAPVFRYASLESFHAELCKQWLSGFAPPIPKEPVVEGWLADPAINDSLTVAALKLRALFFERAKVIDDTLVFPADAIEGLCRSAVNEVFLAIKDPNQANHELLHGDHERTR